MNRYSARDIAEMRAGMERMRLARQNALATRKKEALARARQAAALIRARYGGRVILFGSIDLAVEGLPCSVDFWRLCADLLALAEPFNVDLVLLEEASPGFRQHIRQKGVVL